MAGPTPIQRQLVKQLASEGKPLPLIEMLSGIPAEMLISDYQAELQEGAMLGRKNAFDAAWQKLTMDIQMKWACGMDAPANMKGFEPEVYLARMKMRLWKIGSTMPQSKFLDDRLVRFVKEFDPNLLPTLSFSDLTNLAQAALGKSVSMDDVQTMQNAMGDKPAANDL